MSVVIHWALCEIEHVIEIYQFLRANLSRIFTPVFRHSFSTASRRIRDAMVHPCVSLFPRSSNFHYTRASFFFFANFIYFQARRKIIKFRRNTSLRVLYIFQILSSISFHPPILSQIYRDNIYISTVDQAIVFKKTIGRVYLQQRTSYEVLKDSDRKVGKAREVGCTVARLRYFSSTFVFSFIPYSPRFKRNFLQLSYTSRSTLFTSSFTLRVYIYIYI